MSGVPLRWGPAKVRSYPGVGMSMAERYRSRAADLNSLADRQADLAAAEEWRTMAESYLRLAAFVEVSDRPAIQLEAQDPLKDYQQRHRRKVEEILNAE